MSDFDFSYNPRPGEVSMKEWRIAEAAAHGLTESAVAMRLARGAYPELNIRRVNPRRVFVSIPTKPQ